MTLYDICFLNTIPYINNKVVNMSVEIVFEEESDLNDLSDDSTDAVFDLDDYCRTCLRRECCLTPTNSSDSDSIKFCDKLAACISEMMWAKKGDPSFICGKCIEKLRIAHNFQTVCLQSNRALCRYTHQLQGEANQRRSSRNVTPNSVATTSLARCDKTIGKVILSAKYVEMQMQSLPQGAPVTSAAAQLEAVQMLDNPRKRSCQEETNLNALIMDAEFDVAVCCRTCLRRASPLTTTNSLDSDSIRFCDKLAACVSGIMWIKENFPFICAICIEKVRIAYDFRAVCLQSDQKFQRYVNQLREHIGKHTVHMEEYTGDKFSCDLCGNKFTQRSSLKGHVKVHTANKLSRCEICNKSYRQYRRVLVHMKKHTGRSFSCTACDKRFSQISYLNRHMNTHIGGKPYTCSNCSRGFMTSSDLAVHLRRYKIYTQSSSFKTHSKKHTGEKFSCKLPGSNFIQPSALSRHMKEHTDNKLWRCEICNKSYQEYSHLSVHLKKHTEENFSCKACDKKFTQNFHLDKHMITHIDGKPYICDNCNEGINSKTHLKKHTGEKFLCHLCGEFIRCSALNKHMNTHIGNHFWRCEICDISYRSYRHLSGHMKKHTEENFSCKV